MRQVSALNVNHMPDFHGDSTRVLENQFVRLEYLTGSARIVRFSIQGQPNLFADLGKTPTPTPHGDFYYRGGHRLWHSPEALPRTYIPEDDGATVTATENGVRIEQPAEPWTHIAKRIEINLDAGQPRVIVRHELRNEGAWTVELAPWALTMFRLGGIGIFPQPEGNVDTAGLLPNRQITLWPYARLDDSRLSLRDDFILVRAQAQLPPLKFGCFNRHGWIAYWLDGVLFVKRFETRMGAGAYPDGGCNVETYCNDQFFELETLGPLTKLEPGAPVFHTETWEIYDRLDVLSIPVDIHQIIASYREAGFSANA